MHFYTAVVGMLSITMSRNFGFGQNCTRSQNTGTDQGYYPGSGRYHLSQDGVLALRD
jgi:hypothetical protein